MTAQTPTLTSYNHKGSWMTLKALVINNKHTIATQRQLGESAALKKKSVPPKMK